MGTDLMIIESAATVLNMADSAVSISTAVAGKTNKLDRVRFKEELRLLQVMCRERGLEILSDERFRIMDKAYARLATYTPGTIAYEDCAESIRHLSAMLRRNIERYFGPF